MKGDGRLAVYVEGRKHDFAIMVHDQDSSFSALPQICQPFSTPLNTGKIKIILGEPWCLARKGICFFLPDAVAEYLDPSALQAS